MAKTAEAAAGASGLSPMAQFGGQAFGMADKALGGLGQAAGTMGKVNGAMQMANMFAPQQPQMMPPPPPAPQAPPTPVNAGYGQQNMPEQPPPGMDPMMWEQIKRRRMMGGNQ